MEFSLSRAVNIMMIFVWLIAQTLVASHVQAHAHGSMNHAASISMPLVSETFPVHDHRHHVVQHKIVDQDDLGNMTGDMSDTTDDCCGVPCQSAEVYHLQPFGSAMTPGKLNSVHLSSRVFWTPGFQTPPPNPAI